MRFPTRTAAMLATIATTAFACSRQQSATEQVRNQAAEVAQTRDHDQAELEKRCLLYTSDAADE